MVVLEKLRGEFEDLKKCGFGSKLLILYILMSPVIDILTSVGRREFQLSISAGIILKGVLLAVVLLLYLKEKSQNRFEKLLKGLVFLFVVYAIIHLGLAYRFYGLSRTLTALVTLAKTFYLPLLAISLYKLIVKEDVPMIQRALMYSVVFIIGSIVVSMITGTGYDAYRWTKRGTVGWFYAANELSATLALLTPFVVYYVMEKARLTLGKSLLVVTIYAWIFYQIGTKVVALSVILTMAFLFMMMVLKKILYQKAPIVRPLISLGLLLIISVALVPVSPVGFNLNAHQAIVDHHGTDQVVFDLEESIAEAIKEETPQNPDPSSPTDPSKPSDPLNEEGLTQEEVIQQALKRYSFGEMSANERRLVRLIFSGRDGYFFMRLFLHDHSAFIQKIFGGTQFSESPSGKIRSYIVEIDYFDIYFNFGVIGTLLYWGMFLSILIYGLLTALRKKRFFLAGSALPYYACAIIMAFGIGMFAGHVFVSPAVSFYLAILSTLFILESGVQTKQKSIKSTL